MRAYNYNSSDTDNPHSAYFGIQVTKSGTVDYLFSHRLRFARNLTNESITTPQYVVSLTNNWENFGYTTIANLKTTLGIGATTASGTANRLAYYSSASAISSAGNIAYLTGNSTASTPAT
jgi:hypothetical protein